MLKVVLLVMCGVAMASAALARSADDIQSYRDFLEKSVNGTYQEPLTPELAVLQNEWERSGKFEGDMVLSKKQIEQLVEEYSGARNAMLRKSLLWPNRTLYYYIIEADFNKHQNNIIKWGIKSLAALSCVQFKEATPLTPNYVLVQGHEKGCFSRLGFQGNAQILNLNTSNEYPGCFVHGSVVHQFLHALGFLHMHSTYNRDDYVMIMDHKIEEGYKHHFQKYNSSVVSNLGVEYDYDSVLHYDEYAFSIDGSKTILTLKKTNGEIGHKPKLSKGDIIKLNRLYDCPGH